MIKIVPTTLDELDELVSQQAQDGFPEIFYRFGFQIIHPETGRPCAGGGISSMVQFSGSPSDVPALGGAGGSGPIEIKVDYRASEPEDL
jgi:hypothetical protein